MTIIINQPGNYFHGKSHDEMTEVVRQNGQALGHVSENLKTLELCLIVVRQDELNLRFVPEHLKASVLAALKVS
jgi:ribosomal 30S subunit maturation factor RimM